MRRIYLIWFFRRLVFSPWPRLVAAGLVAGWLSLFVSLGHIWENMSLIDGWSGYLGLFTSAVASTERVVLFLSVLILALAAWLLKDLAGFLGGRIRFID